MERKRFNMQGLPSSIVLEQDAQTLNKVPLDKLKELIEWTVRHRILKDIHLEGEFADIVAHFGFANVSELNSATRLLDVVFIQGNPSYPNDIVADLERVNLKKEIIEKTIEYFKEEWQKYSEFLERARTEAIPVLTSIHWRVDIRLGSSDFLAKPEAIALLRIGSNDGLVRKEVYLELGRNDLAYLESAISKIRKEVLSAEASIAKIS